MQWYRAYSLPLEQIVNFAIDQQFLARSHYRADHIIPAGERGQRNDSKAPLAVVLRKQIPNPIEKAPLNSLSPVVLDRSQVYSSSRRAEK